MIDTKKQYKTRCGYPVRILCVDRVGGNYPVVGLVMIRGAETEESWTLDGRFSTLSRDEYDLVEVGGEG